MNYLQHISFTYPKQLVFGAGCRSNVIADCSKIGIKRLFIITIPPLLSEITEWADILNNAGIETEVTLYTNAEPTFADAEELIVKAESFNADGIAGIGGGSVLDIAKVAAALIHSDQDLKEIVGNGLVKSRKTHLICIPTTAGTGSEVSPNSILIDNSDHSKQGIISPFLLPDSTYIDPGFTVGLPPDVTAYTGIDALTHCIEAFTNRFSHPIADMLAIEGIRLIANNLKYAYDDGSNIEARSKLALGSVYGGMCLGPVNTAAVHALAYPLGTDFKIPHGLSNAVLLPYVMEYNVDAAFNKYAQIGVAIGAIGDSESDIARNGIVKIKELLTDCKIPSSLSEIGIPESAIDKMTDAAFKIQRLLKNNIKKLSINDIKIIYKSAL